MEGKALHKKPGHRAGYREGKEQESYNSPPLPEFKLLNCCER
ncbi:hypothetical protein A8U91_04485 [Halomonas elongata]|uniref:Uncharacterized protein n=1 Tax=Halomonas elongata TaxID=2746 RepID=A0A1B8NZJ2_HALEL|nr:hypothetical protein A8U91_04485 [Halomonas elongata]